MKTKRIGPVVQRQGVGDHAGAGDAHQSVGEARWEQIGAGEQQRRRAIRIGRDIEHIERFADHVCPGIRLRPNRLAEHGLRVANAVGMGGQGKTGKTLAGHIVFVHVAAHQQRRLGNGVRP